MRAVIQRVKRASVDALGRRVSEIGPGLLVLLGVRRGDTAEAAEALAEKTLHLRIFDDPSGVMNLSVTDLGGEILAVSQFTLLADARKGRRPSYIEAAPPEEARRLYELFCDLLAAGGLKIERGVFQAHMEVALTNDGPVTILLDSEKTF